MVTLNCTKHYSIAGSLNLSFDHKDIIIDNLYSYDIHTDKRMEIILHEIFLDLNKKGLSSKNLILQIGACCNILYPLIKEFKNLNIEVEIIWK